MLDLTLTLHLLCTILVSAVLCISQWKVAKMKDHILLVRSVIFILSTDKHLVSYVFFSFGAN